MSKAVAYAERRGGECLDDISRIVRQYTDDPKKASKIIDKHLRNREFVVFDFTKAVDDPLSVRLDACKIATERNGLCLSDSYINCNTSLLWKCAKGHEWMAPFHRIKNAKKWCPHCSKSKSYTIDDAKRVANNKNGECLSEKYINSILPLRWRCAEGHEWYSALRNVKYCNTWCPDCAHTRPLTLEEAKQIAHSRNGECLSEIFINIRSPLLWKCAKGHKWSVSLTSIKHCNSWCPYCVGTRRLTLEEAKHIAHSRNGECLSEVFVNIRSPLLWKCAKGHEWYSTLKNIKNSNSWCPFCRFYKRENLCRRIVTKYLGPPSENRWPDFLRTPEYPNGLELDIPYYNYGFAIEVQGEQHAKYHEFFHKKNPNNFIKQQERDQLKVELCEENWIVLRYVWYYEDPYIVIPEHLRELGLIE
ncbi:11417_t:CDS:2 [Entrophospora sp. SA101]|nr:11417_t:CDS:2 [Entrophospora sp. SA101]